MKRNQAPEFRKALLEKGLDAAIRIRDSRKAELDQARERLQRELSAVDQELASLQRDFSDAVRGALESAGVGRPSGKGLLPGKTYAQWILDSLAEHGGTVFGPDLYDSWQQETGDHSRKNRLMIQSVVSQLIAKGQVGKVHPRDMPDVPTGGRRGSALTLKSSG